MKTFEEKYTAWIDGNLSNEELAQFSEKLPAGADHDKAAALKLGSLLRSHATVPPMANADFFNHQLMQQIGAEQNGARPIKRGLFRWTLPRMAWAGACCMAVAFAMYQTMVRNSLQPPPTESEYLAKVLDTRTDDPAITARVFQSKERDVTVIWLNGLTYLPDSYGL